MDIWHIPLDPPAPLLAGLAALLDPVEQARARRLAGEGSRRRFIAAHAALRLVVGRLLDAPPQALRWEFNASGKPGLAGHPLHFNLTHAGDLALVAASRRGPVGIDLEMLDQAGERAADLVDVLAPQEREAIAALPAAERPLATYRCWTRKEALLKALGCGITQGLDRFTVSCDARAQLLGSQHPGLDARHWSVQDLGLSGRWTAAVAIRGLAVPWQAHLWRWDAQHPPRPRQ